MKRKENRKAKQSGSSGKLSMSAMIDVVFLLLVFFVIVVKPQDILAGLRIWRPQPAPSTHVKPRLVQIRISADGYAVNDRRTSLERIDTYLGGLASYSTNTPVTITSTGDAPHSSLVRLLDTCKKWDLWDLRLFSL